MTPQSKKSPDAFPSADEIRSATFVRHVEIHDTLDSTNNRAATLARDTAIELPALIVARHQTAGRGRGTNKWRSADGGLTFSLLIDPATHGITTANWPQLSLATAVAVCEAVEAGSRELGARSDSIFPIPYSPLPVPCTIKWPNDVFVGDRKIAGILLESPGSVAPAKDRLILGIGVNVNNSWHDAPSDMTARATALCDLTGRRHNLAQLLTDCLHALDQRITQLAARNPQLPGTWQQRCYLTGQTVTITNNGRTTTGRCLGIADHGALVVQTRTGTECLHSGSVTTRTSE